MSVKLLFLAGSARKESYNKKLAKAAADMASDLGADAEFIDLADYAMPIFCEDLEAENGLPQAAKDLRQKFNDADGFLITCPEYNSSITPLLKNTIDWMTRKEEGDPPLTPFKGKVAALSATSLGALGGLRGMVVVRMLLGNIGVTVTPSQYALGGAGGAFDESGALTDEKNKKAVHNVVKELVETAQFLSA